MTYFAYAKTKTPFFATKIVQFLCDRLNTKFQFVTVQSGSGTMELEEVVTMMSSRFIFNR